MTILPTGELYLTPLQYDALYARKPLPGISLDIPVWDSADPSPTVVRWHDAGLITGQVLDAGCGTGSNAVWLAQHNYQVTGFDAAPHALDIARTRANDDLPVRFTIADAIDLKLPTAYNTVIDSALYHCLTIEQRQVYIRELHRVCRTDARLLMTCVSEALPTTLPGPFRITRDELYATLPPAGWAITDITPGVISVAFTLDLLRTVCAAINLPEPSGDEVAFSGGFAQFPAWEVVAERQN
ncbi:class I SAM-dependent methyltransferase [Saccharopolyspora sp. ASAGF58]|uniref:class I SAM-dependent methyltransferase n=1 Tax=Saccharopolyspora sp. ASAGF58 TaxID=2719023 RepID=UPI001446F80D|nr:class I SAM-dependent methyltransferase [Saccharopolyspora sp. ASAGF58]